MKKLMIAACVIAMAAVSQAVDFKWGHAQWECIYVQNDSTPAAGPAYLIDANVQSQKAFIEAFANGASAASLVSIGLLDTYETLSAYGEMPSASDQMQKFTPTGYTAADTLTAYVAVIAKDADGKDIVYLSPTDTKGAQAASAPELTYSTYETSSVTGFKVEAGDTFQGAGWYSAVPEPTSGLLLLLGVAGLALRRRRA